MGAEGSRICSSIGAPDAKPDGEKPAFPVQPITPRGPPEPAEAQEAGTPSPVVQAETPRQVIYSGPTRSQPHATPTQAIGHMNDVIGRMKQQLTDEAEQTPPSQQSEPESEVAVDINVPDSGLNIVRSGEAAPPVVFDDAAQEALNLADELMKSMMSSSLDNDLNEVQSVLQDADSRQAELEQELDENREERKRRRSLVDTPLEYARMVHLSKSSEADKPSTDVEESVETSEAAMVQPAPEVEVEVEAEPKGNDNDDEELYYDESEEEEHAEHAEESQSASVPVDNEEEELANWEIESGVDHVDLDARPEEIDLEEDEEYEDSLTDNSEESTAVSLVGDIPQKLRDMVSSERLEDITEVFEALEEKAMHNPERGLGYVLESELLDLVEDELSRAEAQAITSQYVVKPLLKSAANKDPRFFLEQFIRMLVEQDKIARVLLHEGEEKAVEAKHPSKQRGGRRLSVVELNQATRDTLDILKVMDPEDTGKVDMIELLKVIKDVQDNISDQQVEKLISAANPTNETFMRRGEFLWMMRMIVESTTDVDGNLVLPDESGEIPGARYIPHHARRRSSGASDITS